MNVACTSVHVMLQKNKYHCLYTRLGCCFALLNPPGCVFTAAIGLVHIFQAEFSQMATTNKAPCKENEDSLSLNENSGKFLNLVFHLHFCVGTYSHGDTSDLVRVGVRTPSTKELLLDLIHLQTNK